MGEFAEGLRKFFTRGSLVKKVRLNEKMRRIISKLVNESLDKTSIMFEEEHQVEYEEFMESIEWVKKQINENIFNVTLDKRKAWVIHKWIISQKHHPLSDDPEFDKAMQWLTNKINSKYSIAEMASS